MNDTGATEVLGLNDPPSLRMLARLVGAVPASDAPTREQRFRHVRLTAAQSVRLIRQKQRPERTAAAARKIPVPMSWKGQ